MKMADFTITNKMYFGRESRKHKTQNFSRHNVFIERLCASNFCRTQDIAIDKES